MGTHRGVLMHQQVGYGSLHGFFSNPASEVSAHFWISRAGVVEQYVDTSTVAWHARQLNTQWCGIEFEGMPTDPITEGQIAAGGRVLAEGARVHGWLLRKAESSSEHGFGYHRMPGGVNTACPSDLRLGARDAILAAAMGGEPSAGPGPAERKGRNMIANTESGEGYWLAKPDGAVYAFGDAAFRGSANVDEDGPDLLGGTEIVGIAGVGNDGYRLAGSDGAVYCYGSADYYGRADR